MSKPDLEAQVTPKIRGAIQAALDRIGPKEFLTIAGIDDQHLSEILGEGDVFVSVALVTLACQINKGQDDPDPAHSSVSECLKGSIIRIPPVSSQSKSKITLQPKTSRSPQTVAGCGGSAARLYEKKSLRILSFSANTFAFLILGYFLGGIGISPLVGEPSCIGVIISPPSLSPCSGSIIGLVIGAIGGIGYTYYYFVKKL